VPYYTLNLNQNLQEGYFLRYFLSWFLNFSPTAEPSCFSTDTPLYMILNEFHPQPTSENLQFLETHFCWARNETLQKNTPIMFTMTLCPSVRVFACNNSIFIQFHTGWSYYNLPPYSIFG
jgi:hypothetical protein